MARYEVWQDGVRVAAVDGPEKAARRDGMHYLAQYAQDGPAVLYRIVGRKRTIAAMEGKAADLAAALRRDALAARDGEEAGR